MRSLSALLDQVAEGDLSAVPAAGDGADPVTVEPRGRVRRHAAGAAPRSCARWTRSPTSSPAGPSTWPASAEQEAAAISAQVSAVAETTSTIEELAATAAQHRRDGAVPGGAVRGQHPPRRRRRRGRGRRVDRGRWQRIADAGHRPRPAQPARLHGAHRPDRRHHAASSTSWPGGRRSCALNASIEAARAGDHGHGFGTVAAEVGVARRPGPRGDRPRSTASSATSRREAAATAAASREGLRGGRRRRRAGSATSSSALGRIARMVDRTTAAAREITVATRRQRVASDAVVAAMGGDRGRRTATGRVAAGTRRPPAGCATSPPSCRTTLGRFRLR